MGKRSGAAQAAANNGPLGFVLFIAYIGALVYFINQASGFWSVVWSFFKAAAWPGILIYRAFELLKV